MGEPDSVVNVDQLLRAWRLRCLLRRCVGPVGFSACYSRCGRKQRICPLCIGILEIGRSPASSVQRPEKDVGLPDTEEKGIDDTGGQQDEFQVVIALPALKELLFDPA